MIEATFQMSYTESRMWENLCYATASQAGSMRGNRRKTAKFVLRVAKGRVGVSNEGHPVLHHTSWKAEGKIRL